MPTMIEDMELPPVVMPSCEIRKTLAGQKALVTGANSGIGKGVAIALGRAGAEVVVNYVARPEQAEEVVAADSRRRRHRATPVRPTSSGGPGPGDVRVDVRSSSARSTSWSTTPACSATPGSTR